MLKSVLTVFTSALLLASVSLLATDAIHLEPVAITSQDSAALLKIEQVEMLEGGLSFPDPEADWQDISLPHKLMIQDWQSLPSEYIWYRFSVKSEQALSLYIPHHYYNLAVWVNGSKVGGSLEPEGKQAVGFSYPLLVVMNEKFWDSEQENEVLIRLSAGPPMTLLSDIYLAPASKLKAFWMGKVSFQVVSSFVSILICALMAVFTLILWALRKKDTENLWFSAASAFWILPLLYMVLPFAPVSHDRWLIMSFIGLDLSFLALFSYINHLLSLSLTRLNQLAFYKSILVFVLFSSLNVSQANLLNFYVCSFNLVLLVIVFVLAVKRFLQEKDRNALWVSLAFLAVVGIFVHDLYIFIVSIVKTEMISGMTWFQAGYPVLLLILFANLSRRFVNALEEAEVLNLELEQRVRKNAEALEKSFRENRDLEMRQAATEEKQRIYQDLHDDVGSKLVSIIHNKEEGRSRDMAKSALESLRESVAKAKAEDQPLELMLENIREEAEVRCVNADLAFQYKADAIPDYVCKSELAFQLTRIVREAVSNIIKHAQASEVSLIVNVVQNEIRLTIRDNGLGLSSDYEGGSGFAIMQTRADSIDAQLEFRAVNLGCELLMKFSL